MLFPGTCCYWKTNLGHVLETAIMMPLFYPLITGKGGGLLKKVFEKKMNQGNDSSDYMKKFMDMMGGKQRHGFLVYFQRIHEKSVL